MAEKDIRSKYYYVWDIIYKNEREKERKNKHYYIWKHKNGCYYGYYSKTQDIFNKLKDSITRPNRVKKAMEQVEALSDLIDERCQAEINLDNTNRYVKGFDLSILPMEFYYFSKYGKNDWNYHERMIRDSIRDNQYYSAAVNNIVETSIRKLDEFGDSVELESIGRYGTFKAKNKNGENILLAVDTAYPRDKKDADGYHVELFFTTISKKETKCCQVSYDRKNDDFKYELVKYPYKNIKEYREIFKVEYGYKDKEDSFMEVYNPDVNKKNVTYLNGDMPVAIGGLQKEDYKLLGKAYDYGYDKFEKGIKGLEIFSHCLKACGVESSIKLKPFDYNNRRYYKGTIPGQKEKVVVRFYPGGYIDGCPEVSLTRKNSYIVVNFHLINYNSVEISERRKYKNKKKENGSKVYEYAKDWI